MDLTRLSLSLCSFHWHDIPILWSATGLLRRIRLCSHNLLRKHTPCNMLPSFQIPCNNVSLQELDCCVIVGDDLGSKVVLD
jgi:hypothetical protein